MNFLIFLYVCLKGGYEKLSKSRVQKCVKQLVKEINAEIFAISHLDKDEDFPQEVRVVIRAEKVWLKHIKDSILDQQHSLARDDLQPLSTFVKGILKETGDNVRQVLNTKSDKAQQA